MGIYHRFPVNAGPSCGNVVRATSCGYERKETVAKMAPRLDQVINLAKRRASSTSRAKSIWFLFRMDYYHWALN